MLKLYENIKAFRLLRGMSQDDLAKKVGYSDKSMIAKIEKGDVDLPQSKIMLFAEALGTEPGDLMGWTENDDYHFDPETADIINTAKERPEMKALFSSSRKLTPEAAKTALDIIEALNKNK